MALALDTNGADPVFILERRMASLQDVTKKAVRLKDTGKRAQSVC